MMMIAPNSRARKGGKKMGECGGIMMMMIAPNSRGRTGGKGRGKVEVE